MDGIYIESNIDLPLMRSGIKSGFLQLMKEVDTKNRGKVKLYRFQSLNYRENLNERQYEELKKFAKAGGQPKQQEEKPKGKPGRPPKTSDKE